MAENITKSFKPLYFYLKSVGVAPFHLNSSKKLLIPVNAQVFLFTAILICLTAVLLGRYQVLHADINNKLEFLIILNTFYNVVMAFSVIWYFVSSCVNKEKVTDVWAKFIKLDENSSRDRINYNYIGGLSVTIIVLFNALKASSIIYYVITHGSAIIFQAIIIVFLRLQISTTQVECVTYLVSLREYLKQFPTVSTHARALEFTLNSKHVRNACEVFDLQLLVMKVLSSKIVGLIGEYVAILSVHVYFISSKIYEVKTKNVWQIRLEQSLTWCLDMFLSLSLIMVPACCYLKTVSCISFTNELLCDTTVEVMLFLVPCTLNNGLNLLLLLYGFKNKYT